MLEGHGFLSGFLAADLLCGLYFQHFHRIMPMFHVPSFSPKKTLGQLLMIILGIGAIYAPVPGAFQLGRVMIEVSRRGVEHLINRDNRLARSLPVAQSQLLACTLRWIGSARTIEMTEALRGVHVAILRRLRVFDESLVHKPIDDSPMAQWKAFIANEERRRTAMATFGETRSCAANARYCILINRLHIVLEAEVTTLMHTPPILTSSEIKTLLPCSEALCAFRVAAFCLTTLFCCCCRGGEHAGSLARAQAREYRPDVGAELGQNARFGLFATATGIDLVGTLWRAVSRNCWLIFARRLESED